MDERQRLEQAIVVQESLRGTMDDAIINAAIGTLREKLSTLQKESLPDQQRKLVTILFADIVDSTKIIRDLDPEENMEIMDGALKRLAFPVEQHTGHITRFMGDGFMAIFGAPVAHETDPEMAIRAGLGILGTTHELASEMEAEWGIRDFQVRVGINTGMVALGGITEAQDTVMGSTVNLAKRVESAAPASGLLISHNTYRHVRGIFTVEPQEPITAKGFDKPIMIYLVLQAKPRAFQVRTLTIEGMETRMVGREVELHTLQKAYRNASEVRQTQVVTVIGEAGVGKSRLLYEFDNWIELLPPPTIRFFMGRGRLETQNLPYSLLRDLFAFRFQIQESDRSSEVRNKIEAGFGEMLGVNEEGQMCAHFIGQLLGYDFSDSPYLKGVLEDPQQLRDRSLFFLGEYFKAVSEHNPTVLFLEDIHWADGSSLDMVTQLTQRIPKQNLLIVCLARHRLLDRHPDWGEGLVNHYQVELEPLSEYDSGQLVTEILKKVDEVPLTLRELVVKSAEGNPFYIEELIRMLVEDGIIVKGDDEWSVEPDRLADIEVPPTLTSVLQARLDSLPAVERKALQQASVVGRTFWDRIVEHINSSTDEEVDDEKISNAISGLRGKELIYHQKTSAIAGAGEYIFKHAILRDVTYESVLLRLRRAYHKLVAEWLIEHRSERASEYAALIADHLVLARMNKQAAYYLYQAGEQAAKRYANGEAIALFDRALSLTTSDDLEERCKLLQARERVLGFQGNREAQKENLAELMKIAKLCDNERLSVEVILRMSNFAEVTGDFQASIGWVQDAIKRARKISDGQKADELMAQGHLTWGKVLWHQGIYPKAQVHLEKALKLFQKLRVRPQQAITLRILGNVFLYQEQYDIARDYYQQSGKIYREINDARGEAGCLNNLGIIFGSRCDYAQASAHFQQALTIMQAVGDRRSEANVLLCLGALSNVVGDYVKAKMYTQQSLQINQEIDDRHGKTVALYNLGEYAHKLGEYDQAMALTQQVLAIYKEIEDPEGIAESLNNLAFVLHDLGEYDQAEVNLQKALALRREQGLAHQGVMYDLSGLARVTLSQGDLDLAGFYVDEIFSCMEQEPNLMEAEYILDVYLVCYQVLKARGDKRADDILGQSHTLLQERASRIDNERLRCSFLENITTHRELLQEVARVQS